MRRCCTLLGGGDPGDAGPRAATPATSSPRSTARRPPPTAGRRAPAPVDTRLLARNAGASSSPRRPATRRSASPSSSSSTRTGLARTKPGRRLKDVRVDLPVGLSVNPQATPQCPLATFEANALGCPPTSVSRRQRWSRVAGCSALAGRRRSRRQVYNLVPEQGEPALLRLRAPSATKSSSKPTSNGPATTTRASRSPSPEPPARRSDPQKPAGLQRRAGNGTFLTTPSTCHDPARPPSRTSTRPSCAPTRVEDAEPELPRRLDPRSSRRCRPA